MIGLGIFMSDFLEKTNLDRTKVYELHKSLGVLVIIFFVYRLINRIIHQPPALPIGLKNYEKTLAKLVHYSLYLLMIIAPLSGYLMSNAYGFEVKFFGITLPNLISG
jgi:cytochrome b561